MVKGKFRGVIISWKGFVFQERGKIFPWPNFGVSGCQMRGQRAV